MEKKPVFNVIQKGSQAYLKFPVIASYNDSKSILSTAMWTNLKNLMLDLDTMVHMLMISGIWNPTMDKTNL